jgi:hypothetical protein
MMWTHVLAGILLAAAVQSPAAPSAGAAAPTRPPVAQPAITLTGCIQVDAARPDWFTFSEAKTGTTYRLSGANVKSFVWKKVQIVGGLVPSPNLAAQAGAIDPTKTAMAYQSAVPPGIATVESLEFKVDRVRRLSGSCTPATGR